MKSKLLLLLILLCCTSLISRKTYCQNWVTEKQNGYNLVYTSGDKNNEQEYIELIENGINSAKNFFDDSFNKEFDIIIHPDRNSIDSSWQKDWNMPDFKSECWMVASGVANKLDIISPKMWDKEACEHIYNETEQTQRLITHELVHVYHGQLNASPDFSNTEGIDWFVEGLATYASGQCDTNRISEVRTAISENKIPESLDDFWKGKLRYGLSGSMVMYIDKEFGRKKLKELLSFNKRSEILSALNITEPKLLSEWKKYFRKL